MEVHRQEVSDYESKSCAVNDVKNSLVKNVEHSTQPYRIDTPQKPTSKRKTKRSNKKKQAGPSSNSNLTWTQFYRRIFNVWFQQLIFRHPVYEPPFNPWTISFVDMICIPFYGRTTSHHDIQTGFGRPNEKLWFHGTPSFESAYSILNEGIKLGVSKKRNDFSVGEGFYVSDDFDAACCRANRYQDCGYAVLVFRLWEESLSNCFLDLNIFNILWRQVVRYNRSGFTKETELSAGITQWYLGKENAETLKNLHFNEIDFIKGPICYNVKKILDDNCTETPVYMSNKSGRVIQQLCIRTQNYAQVFGSLANICAVVWFFQRPKQ